MPNGWGSYSLKRECGSVHQTAQNNNLKRKSLESLKSLRWWSEALERKKKQKTILETYRFESCPAGSRSALFLMTCFKTLWVGCLEKKKEGKEEEGEGEEEKKLVQPPFLKISFFRQKRSSRGKPCLPDCLPRTSCCCRRGDVVVRGVEATVCGRLKPAGSRLQQINEKEGRLRAVREWSYFGFPFFGVERYSLVVSCWRRRVSWVASSSGGGRSGDEEAAAAAPTHVEAAAQIGDYYR